MLDSLAGIFDQILGEDETIREKAIEYVSVSLMDMRHVLFIPKEDNEKCLLDLIKKVVCSLYLLLYDHSLGVGGCNCR